jgi:serine protease AprX
VRVIVRSPHGSGDAARAVAEHGGRVTIPLPIVDGVGATVPGGAVERLMRQGFNVAPDSKIGFSGIGGPGTAPQPYKVLRSNGLWQDGIKGGGTTVAVLDTGIHAAHPDLGGPSGSRVIHCEDFSHEADTVAHCKDTFGHGTFMAGLIAGNGASSGWLYRGTAPRAKLVSIKVAGFDGSTDVSNVLAGIQWAVSFRDTYGIDVLSLSLGTDSDQDYRFSPLNLAVERAWQSGIVTVVSAGNSGPHGQTVMKPGDDPYVITVGASNSEHTLAISDDRVPVFSSRGPTAANGLAKPDVVAPGVHTASLRSPGSAIDQKYGSVARIGTQYFRGSGTSMSTALVAGVVAQIVQKNPSLTPDQVKARLLNTARRIRTTAGAAAGWGLVDAAAAARSTSAASANQGLEPSAGTGTLADDRGTLDVDVAVPLLGQFPVVGDRVAQRDPLLISILNPAGLLPWDGVTFTTSTWDPATWDATTWKNEDWAATTWKGTTWKATTWNATTWKGTSWSNVDWDATTWKTVNWDATTWKATTWKSHWYAAAWY